MPTPSARKLVRIATFPLAQIKRVRLVKRADGYYVQFAVQAERHDAAMQPTGKQVGIDVGLKAFYTDSNGATRSPIPAICGKQNRSSSACIGGYLAKSSGPRIARKPSNGWQEGI